MSRETVPLCALLPELGATDIDVRGLALDSRAAAAGDLFLACRGRVDDGRDHIDEARRRGVVAVVAEGRAPATPAADAPRATPLFYVENLAERLAPIADRFYDYPGRALELFGVTGTNGKTSAVWFVAQILNRLGRKSASIGTLGCRCGDELLEETKLTTPDVIELRRLLGRCRDLGAQAAALEMSSHGLDQGRGVDLPITAALFTSFGADHLDYHRDAERYLRAKARLFDMPTLERAAFNLDDPAAAQLAENCDAQIRFYSLSKRARSDIHALDGADPSRVILRTPWGEGELQRPPSAPFMLGNLLGAVALLGDRHPLEELLAAASDIEAPPGRMQSVPNALAMDVRVDYAHTAEALALALAHMRRGCSGRVWCVFGCGGERDRAKRPRMGASAEELADAVTLTDDNPRREDSRMILDDILSGMRHPERAHVEPCRARAIAWTLARAQAGDAVLIAGRGHERRQSFADGDRDFSDVERAIECLRDLEKARQR